MFYANYIRLCNSIQKSPSAVAEEIGIKRSTVTRWKQGNSQTDANVQKVADYFGVTSEYLLTDHSNENEKVPTVGDPIDLSKYHCIPILGRIAAGLPLLAEENIEGYTLTDLNGGAEYFALRVKGDSMNAVGIMEGHLLHVRRQPEVENGEIAVVRVGDDDATVKRFYSAGTTVTLMPQSTNPTHTPQVYDTSKTHIEILGKVVKAEFLL